MVSSVTLVGAKRLQAALDKMDRDMRRKVQKAVDATGLSVLRTIKDSMVRGNPTGEVTVKTKSGKTHTASAPGEPPAVDTGRLVSSITFKNVAPLTVEVFSNLVQAFALEFGRRDGSIKPRPAWVPAIEIEWPAFHRGSEAAVRKAMP